MSARMIVLLVGLTVGVSLSAGINPALGQCEQQKLYTDDSPPPGAAWLIFGARVAVSGDRAVVRAGYGNPVGTIDSGFAYVFRREGTEWVQEARLSPSEGDPLDAFAASVSISNDYLVASGAGVV